MKVYGKLERAQIEHVGALPSASVDKAKGRIVYLTTDDRYYISDGSSWIKAMPDVTTTKGDLTSFSTVPARLGVGSNGQVLTADSGEATGLKWATNPSAPDQSYEISNLSLAASVAASALTIAVKDKSGSDPSGGSVVKVGTRNSSLSTGTYNQRTISSALSMTVSSGSTLGHASAVAHYIYVYLIDNAGTLELAVSSTYYEDHSIISTTAEGGAGAADSNSTIYSTTARSNVAIRLIGRLLSTQATAGTWASAPSEIKLIPFDVKPLVKSKTTTYTVENADDVVLCDTSSAGFTLTLPTAVGISGKKVTIKKIHNSNTLTIATTSSQTIDGATSEFLYGIYGTITVMSDGANWLVLDLHDKKAFTPTLSVAAGGGSTSSPVGAWYRTLKFRSIFVSFDYTGMAGAVIVRFAASQIPDGGPTSNFYSGCGRRPNGSGTSGTIGLFSSNIDMSATAAEFGGSGGAGFWLNYE